MKRTRNFFHVQRFLPTSTGGQGTGTGPVTGFWFSLGLDRVMVESDEEDAWCKGSGGDGSPESACDDAGQQKKKKRKKENLKGSAMSKRCTKR